MKQFAFLCVIVASLLSMVLLAQTVSAATRAPAPAQQTTATAGATTAATAGATTAATAGATTAATAGATTAATATAVTATAVATTVATATTTPGSLPSTGGDSGMTAIMLGAALVFLVLAGATMLLARRENSR